MPELTDLQIKQFAVLVLVSLFVSSVAILLPGKLKAVSEVLPASDFYLKISDGTASETDIEKAVPNDVTEVIINEASFDDLLLCPGIGDKFAEKILLELKYGQFIDWRDFKDRTKINASIIDGLKEAGVRLNREND